MGPDESLPNLSLKDIKNFFDYPTLKAFSADWKQLTEIDKAQIKQGLQDGTLTY